MRTLMVIAGGLLVLGILLAAVRLLAARRDKAYPAVFWAFAVIWAVIASTNMWVGVVHAGYSFVEEFPIFVVILLAPLVPGF